MTDDRSLAMAPRAEFADRLEADLLSVIGGRAEHRFNPELEETLVTIEPTAPISSTRRNPMILTIAAAIVVLAIVVAVAFARRSPSSDGPTDSRQVTFTLHWSYSDTNHDCTAGGNVPVCLNHFDLPGLTELKGDIVGDGYQGVLWNDPVDYSGQLVDHLEHVGAYNIHASVTGCGTEEFMLMEMMQFKSGADRDRPTGTYIGTWQIVPESGRGALDSVTGSGTSSGVFGTAGESGRTFSGTVTCP